MRKTELLRRLPMFADLDEAAARRLARALVTVHAEPGELILGRTGTPRSVMFIATGAVELETAGQKHRLGPGEMFGHIGMLGRRRLRTQVRALTHCTLVGLEEARFRDLLARSAALRVAVEESAARRGVDLGDLVTA
jgi:CPA1 family monovalent cation:H+ antiporter